MSSDDRFEENLRKPSVPTAGQVGDKRPMVVPPRVSPEEHERLKTRLAELEQQLANQPVSSIIPVNGVIHAGRFNLSMLALEYPEDVTTEELDLFGEFLRAVMKAYQFWAGDYANASVRLHQALPDKLAAYLEVDIETLKNWMSVCETLPPARRRARLAYSHHVEVANKALKLGNRVDAVLDHAEKYDLSVRDLRTHIREVLSGKTPKRAATLDTLFSKDRTPGLVEMRRDYAKARKGDKDAMDRMHQHLQAHKNWIRDVEETLKSK